jgi:hypothetical protein
MAEGKGFAHGTGHGIPPMALETEDLVRELASLHRTRHDALRHGSAHALEHHTERMDQLEAEYRNRVPDREVDPRRVRAGARARNP